MHIRASYLAPAYFHFTPVVYAWFAGPFAPFGVPTWKPFLNLRGTPFSVRMRPEPVVFLLLALAPQLTVHC